MAYRNLTYAVLLCCLVSFAPTGCWPQLKPPPEAPPAFSPDLPPEQYASAIEKLEGDANDQAVAPEQTSVHLHLASLYASHKNPGRDYYRALDHITRHLSTRSPSSGLYDAKNLQSLLAEIETARARVIEVQNQCAADKETAHEELIRLRARSNQLQTKADRLERENQTLVEANATLSNNNQELASYNKSLLERNKQFEETIERLKKLEMQLEQKRKSFK